MALASRARIHLERDIVIALVRGVAQIVVVGSVLGLLLNAPVWSSVVALAAMIVAASSIAARRVKGIAGAFQAAVIGISTGAGAVIVLMSLAGVIEMSVSSLIPVGSMLIANTMNTCAQALERFRSDVQAHVGQVEAGLALGAEPEQTVSPYVQSAIQASLIPRIDSLASLGIVWIPGLMAGMVLSGENPVYAAFYQFAVIAMIFASSAFTALTTTLLIRSRAFSPAEQLVLRPKEAQ